MEDGSKRQIYHETYKTWLDFISGMIFTDKGLYMVRSFETGWEQIYFLSYAGECRRLTDGPNWRVSLLRVDEKTGDVYFTAERDARIHQALYKVDAKGRITALTDPQYSVSQVSFSPDGKHFVASLSNYTTPTQIWEDALKAILLPMLDLMVPVITSTEGRWVATTRCIPAARASAARRLIAFSTSLEATIIRSASSSMMMTTLGMG